MHGCSALPQMLGQAETLRVGGSNLSAEEPLCLFWLGLGCRKTGLLSWGGGWLEAKGRQCQSPPRVMHDGCMCASSDTPITPTGQCKPNTCAATHCPVRVHGVG